MIRMRLKEILDNKGISITELHERTGISKNTISLMVNNKSKGIQYDTLNKILNATNVKISDLLEEVTDLYAMHVKSIENDYTPLKSHECRPFRYQIWADLESGGEPELIYDFSFSVLYFKVNSKNEKSYLHITFDDYKSEHTNHDLSIKFNPNENKIALNVMAYLIVTDLLWNMDFANKETPSLAYVNWEGFERGSIFGLSINVPISYADPEDLSWENFKKGKVGNNKKIANFAYLKFKYPDVEDIHFDKETGETAIFFHFN